MALTLVTGGAGAGKTEYIYKKIIDWSLKEPERQFFVIVPEQATMQAQKDIIRLHPHHGTMNIDMVSFQRLAYRIFSELSMQQPEVLDDTGKTMVLRKLAGERKRDLAVFSSHLNQAGFINEVKSMLSEFYQYGVTPEILAEQMEKEGMSRILVRKLEDMNVIFDAFREFTKERYITMEELLDVLCGVVGCSELLKDSVIVLDGYTGFTPVQYRLIGLLLKLCKDVYVTVTATDGVLDGPGNEADLFDMSRKMAGKLKALAGESGVEVCEDLKLCEHPLPRFMRSPSLDYLERTMFRYPYRPFEEVPKGIQLVQAENPADEVDFVVNRIHQLVKRENYRYREIAVVCGNLDGYAKEITHQFEENEIPFFLDEKRDVSGNPFIRLMKAALEVVRRGFDYENMFQYLRTGLVTDETEKIDRLELYVRAMGIRGFAKWSETWERTFEGGGRLNLVELNAFKDEILAPLETLKEQMSQQPCSVAMMTTALVSLLEKLEIEQKLIDQAKWFKEKHMEKEAREY
ncbi:MAG: exodeoxyribonuclease V subunit gamma, partial [Lachnospiraceae bacterium]|nr:exodeoxyribonuclease V subunit gamma [Lachnospiraceae bacterium]